MNGRLDYLSQLQPQFQSCLVNFCDNARMLFRCANEATLSALPATYFKLRLDERDQATRFLQQWNNCRHDLGCGNKRDIHHHQIKFAVEVGWLQETRIDAFSDFNSGVSAQSIVYLVATNIEGDDARSSVLQQTIREAAG